MGRPSKPLLSTDRITSAAMDLVSKTGGFTVPELARALKVSPSSLYNHVTGREQIVELLRERAMSEVAVGADDPSRPWTDVVADIMRSYRQSYARYPRLIPLLTAHAVNSYHAITMYNVLAVTFSRAGFDPADTLRAITLVDSFVLGSALDVAAPDEPWQNSAEVGAELSAALATGSTKPERADDAFEFGMAVLLRGLAAMRSDAAVPR
ncbi:TetR family transcriptional regulator [Mycobacterium sp. CBMA 234]|uniref:TetR/AcrR family transcriptional regulator C-terminal domain-containing protein n=1 Tax=Mycolicibacterium sp. CBMA 234 TaxID=1918495 RepID=UPI0012DE6AA8|nr:TetR/AcrR family transcriptional regulator C-terminal domain-containing protein [Mycolicibacterium sp. CBMA 234]MUL65451.1 TetR family transcriptional regulator [Mycolicibacterium sp. CBMA 234]